MNELNKTVQALQAGAGALKACGIVHAAVFGSAARGTDHSGSDIDIVIDLDATRALNVFDYAAIKDEIKAIVGGDVDIVPREGLKPSIRKHVESEAIDAF